MYFCHKSITKLDVTEPPKGVTATVSNDKKFINISWNYTSFSDTGGFFVYNVTVAAPTQSPYTKILSYNVTSVSVLDPIPNVLYTVTVGYIVYDGGDVAGPVATTSVVMAVSTSSPSSGGLNNGMLHLIIITLVKFLTGVYASAASFGVFIALLVIVLIFIIIIK